MFLDLVESRFSARGYKDIPVSRDILDYVFEAARLAPSACNKQPWRFTVVDTPELRNAICDSAMGDVLPNAWARTAPIIIVLSVVYAPIIHSAGRLLKGIDYRLMDAGIAGEHVCLAATEQGLGTCWIGWFRPRVIKKLLGLPYLYKPIALITLGYPAESESVPLKRRMERDEIVHYVSKQNEEII